MGNPDEHQNELCDKLRRVHNAFSTRLLEFAGERRKKGTKILTEKEKELLKVILQLQSITKDIGSPSIGDSFAKEEFLSKYKELLTIYTNDINNLLSFLEEVKTKYIADQEEEEDLSGIGDFLYNGTMSNLRDDTQQNDIIIDVIDTMFTTLTYVSINLRAIFDKYKQRINITKLNIKINEVDSYLSLAYNELYELQKGGGDFQEVIDRVREAQEEIKKIPYKRK